MAGTRIHASYWNWKLLLGGALIVGTILVVAIENRKVPAVIRAADIASATVSPRLDGTHPCVFATITQGKMVTGLGRCSTPTEHTGATDRFETDLRYGAFELRQTDLLLTDGFKVPFTRAYSSDDWLGPSPNHAFGFGSDHQYDVAPAGTRRPYTYMILVLEDGDFLYFKRISTGGDFQNAVYMHTETSTRFYKALLFWNGDGWTLRLADGTEMYFPEAYRATNAAQGAAYEIKYADGATLLLKRDRRRNLKEILTPHGHWIRFTDDRQSRIVRAWDDRGTSVRYGYNSDGMLVYVEQSTGAGRYYQYQGQLMTAVLDEDSHTLVSNWYESGRLVRQVFGNGDQYTYAYVWPYGQYYADRVIVTLPDGRQREIDTADSVPDYIRNQCWRSTVACP